MKAYPAPVLWSALGAMVVTGGLAGFSWQSYRQAYVAEPVAAPIAASEAPQKAADPAPAQTAAMPATAPQADPAAVQPVVAAPPAQAVQVPPPQPDLPSFDVVRVEPDGSAVVAGRALAGSDVVLMDGLAEVDRGKADDNGQFAFVPKSLKPGSHLLTLRMMPQGEAAVDSKQNVTISVPEAEKKGVMVALAQPGEATKILSDPFKSAAGDGTVAIRSVEAESKGGFYASGSAHPGARVWIYLNDTFVAAVTAGGDGLWSLKIEKGVTPGHYDVRADAVTAEGKVLSRAGVTFQMGEPSVAAAPAPPQPAAPSATPVSAAAPATPATVAGNLPQPPAATPQETAAPPASTSTAAASQAAAPPANVVVPEINTAQVKHGDSLWRISRKVYGAGLRYTQIYEANTTQIRNPNLIFPGQIFVLPNSKG